MTQVSRRPIKKELQDKIYELLWDGLARLKNRTDISSFLADILSPTEKVMLSKRLAIALLLFRGWDQEAIEGYLKVSTATVQNIKRVLNSSQTGGYQKVIVQIEGAKEWQKAKTDLAQAFEEILAGRVGANWKVEKSRVAKKYLRKRAMENLL